MNQMSRVYQLALDKLKSPLLARTASAVLRPAARCAERIKSLTAGKRLPPEDTEACRARLARIYPQPQVVPRAGIAAPANGLDVSVIVPVYNAEDSLEQLLDSLFSQETGYSFEVIAVNDGSSDGSGRLLDSRAQKEKRLRVIHRANGGAAAARNEGLDAAGGEYIFFADADDRVLPGAIEHMVRMARQQNLDLVQAAWRYEGGPVQCVRDEVLAGERLLEMTEMPGMPWAKLFRRELFHGVRFPEGYSCFEDSILKCLLLPRCTRVGLCGWVSYAWKRNNPKGLTATSKFAPKTIQAYWVVEEMERQAEKAPDTLGLAILLQQICAVMLPRLAPFERQVQQDAFLLACELVKRYTEAGDSTAWNGRLPYPQKRALQAVERRSLDQALVLSRLWRLMI